MTHTPTPWKIRKDKNDQLNIWADQEWIALLPHQCVRSVEDQQKINAEFIVRACNAHEDVLEFLEHLFKQYDPGDAWNPSDWLRLKGMIKQLKGA